MGAEELSMAYEGTPLLFEDGAVGVEDWLMANPLRSVGRPRGYFLRTSR